MHVIVDMTAGFISKSTEQGSGWGLRIQARTLEHLTRGASLHYFLYFHTYFQDKDFKKGGTLRKGGCESRKKR